MPRTVTYSRTAGNAQRVNCKASSREHARPSSGRTYAREHAQRNNKEPEPETDANWEFVPAVSSKFSALISLPRCADAFRKRQFAILRGCEWPSQRGPDE